MLEEYVLEYFPIQGDFLEVRFEVSHYDLVWVFHFHCLLEYVPHLDQHVYVFCYWCIHSYYQPLFKLHGYGPLRV